MRRAIVLVLDGCGVGAAPNAALFGNAADSPNTLGHLWEQCGPIHAPHLVAAGFFRVAGVGPEPIGIAGYQVRYGRLEPRSQGGKDSVTGHWEMMGIELAEPFPTYPAGFPETMLHPVREFVRQVGTAAPGDVLGNRPASGTAIIAELGEEHLRSGWPIVYTSADSVFQIAVHEDIWPIERLYELCAVVRAETSVQRVIARPFVGESGNYTRTDRRRDWPLPPPLNDIDVVGDVYGIGVVPELFGHRGFRVVRRTQSNAEHADMLREAMQSDARFIFANFEDFDMRFGHRNDAPGFARCLVEFDATFAEVLSSLQVEDRLFLTADHGNDPTTPSTDHDREFVPFVELGQGSGVERLTDGCGMAEIGRRVRAWLNGAIS